MVRDTIKNVLMILMILFGIFFMFVHYRFKYFYMFFFISFFVGYFIFYQIDKLKLSEGYKLSIAIILWLNLLGELLFYDYWQFYDKVLHFFVPMIIVSAICDYFNKHKMDNKLFPILSTLGILAGWEIVEYYIELLFNIQMQGVIHNGIVIMSPLKDTIMDLVDGLFGSSVFLLLNKNSKSKNINTMQY